MFLSLERTLRVTSLLACIAVVAMLAIFVVTGIGQDPLQFVHSSEDYGRLLTKNPAALRACLGFDDVFIALYATAFVALGVLLVRGGSNRALVTTAVALLLALALLDLAENMHFLVMLAAAEQGRLPGATEISLQVWESLVKFHVSYLGLFLLGFALPRGTARGRLLANLSWYVQLPVGVLVYVTPPAVALPLVFVRFTYFLVALWLVATLFPPPAPAATSAHDVLDAAGSGARA